jgi:hypothetical protein
VFVYIDEKMVRIRGLSNELVMLAAHINAATARWLDLLAEFDDLHGWEGFKDCAHWLGWRCGIAPGTARDHVRVAQALKSRPAIAAVFARGELSYSKVRALMRLDDDFDEAQALRFAQSASAGQLERIVRGCRKCVAVEKDEAKRFAEREFSWSHDDEGGVVFRGRLPVEVGALVIRAIEAARDELGPPPAELLEDVSAETVWDRENTMSPRARNADALVAVAQSALAPKASSADVYQVVVHVDADALTSTGDMSAPASVVSAETSRRCELENGQPLSQEMVRRLCCDGSIARILERDGNPLSIGRKTRSIPPAMRRALRAAHGCCAFPGCSQTHHLDAHHIEHWVDGGETKLENLIHLCRHHHRLMHEGGFAIRRKGSGFIFVSPQGKLIPQAPRMPRGECRSIVQKNHRSGLRPTGSTLFPRDSTGENVDLSLTVNAMAERRAQRQAQADESANLATVDRRSARA